jgi:hypothetical protein
MDDAFEGRPDQSLATWCIRGAGNATMTAVLENPLLVERNLL